MVILALFNFSKHLTYYIACVRGDETRYKGTSERPPQEQFRCSHQKQMGRFFGRPTEEADADRHGYEEFARLAETSLARNTSDYIHAT